MRRPSARQLDPALAAAAREVSTALAAAGHRAWIVGGAVRDLVLEREPSDIDMVSAATPDEVEHIFANTVPLGRRFGTLLVPAAGFQVELTTFRTESDYADGRRPDLVHWGTSVEEDALRRDFTCNALYLDPTDDELRDPTGGCRDLEGGALVTVGDPVERFKEDGLRLLRMARLACELDLEPTAEVLAGARAAAAALGDISTERVARELQRIFNGPAPGRGLAILTDLDLLGRAIPGWAPEGASLRWDALEALPSPPGEALGHAVLLEPEPTSPGGEPETPAGMRLLDGLRPSRQLRRTVVDLWRCRALLEQCAGRPLQRSERLRLFREEQWDTAGRLAIAWRRAQGRDDRPLLALVAEARSLSTEDLWPRALLETPDLEAAGLERGPRWGAALRDLEDAQLDGRVGSRAEALAWIEQRAAAAGTSGASPAHGESPSTGGQDGG